ncbi:LPS export ABC transporter periplasmic protein LptC, partial [Ameyamaea chiangmaiensis]
QRAALGAARASTRAIPGESELARRRQLLRWAKWVLPGCALLLLVSIAVWPEIDHLINSNRIALTQAARLRIRSGNMSGAIYRGLDTHQRPYMITADSAVQVDPERVDLVRPVADTLLSGRGWVMVTGDTGVYMQHAQTLQLTGNVTLYRNDGIIMYGPTADIDLKRGIVASDTWVHAEGPFGVLDAQGWFLAQHEGLAQFRGPGRLILNDDSGADKSAASARSAPAGTTVSGPHSTGTQP